MIVLDEEGGQDHGSTQRIVDKCGLKDDSCLNLSFSLGSIFIHIQIGYLKQSTDMIHSFHKMLLLAKPKLSTDGYACLREMMQSLSGHDMDTKVRLV